MRSIHACLLGLVITGLAAVPSLAAESLKIGVVAPVSDGGAGGR